ncbi:MAG TPA: hypothetical protein VFC89_00035 [Oscillospiraceae bacterium]|nr:hypothetical protein [Oscillospiraceae bacterium]
MRIILTLRDSLYTWVDLSLLSSVADRLTELDSDPLMSDLRLRYGRELIPIDILFDVQFEQEEDPMLVLQGDCSLAMGIGAGMTKGSIWVQGDAGPGLAEEIKGGSIRVSGQVKGECCDFMRNGFVLIEGKVDGELCRCMRRGLVVVEKMHESVIGRNMLGGTVVVSKELGPDVRIGPCMDRGSMIFPSGVDIPDDFYMTEKLPSSFVQLIFEEIRKRDIPLQSSWQQVLFQRYRGARSGLGKAEIFVAEKLG